MLSGCTAYQPRPLPESVLEGMVTPTESSIRERVSNLPDPRLSSVRIDLSDGISPDEAEVISIALNPALIAERSRRGIATAETFNAGLLPDPTLSLSVDQPAGGATTDTVTGVSLGVDWALSDLIERPARRASARRNAESVDLQVLWAETIQGVNARSLVYEVAAWESSIQLLDEQIGLLRDQVGRMTKALKEGQVTAIELSAAQTSLDSFLAQRADAQEQLQASKIGLFTEMGFPPDAPFDVNVDMSVGLEEPAPALDTIVASMESDRLDLMALRKGYESQEEQVRLAILRQFPRLSLGPSLARDTGDLTTIGDPAALEQIREALA